MAGPTPYSPPTVHPALDPVISQLLAASISKSTHKLYNRCWSSFKSFHMQYFTVVPSIPVSVNSIIGFIAHLHESGYSSSTIKSYISALSYFHKLSSTNDPTTSFLIKKLIIGTGSLARNPAVRLPITISILSKLTQAVKYVESSHYHQTLISAMFMLSFHAFLRVGEFTVTQSASHTLQHSDIILDRSSTCQPTIRISFKSFKHQKDSYHPVLEIKSPNPVQIVSKFLRIRPSIPGPLFIFPDSTPVSSSYFGSVLKSCLVHLGLNPSVYKPHSFRIGAATTAASMGFSDTQISTMGRWKSSAFKKYIRIPSLSSM